MIEVENLWFRYPNSKDYALKNINLEIDEKEFVLVAGASGCGKSTLVKTFNGLIPHFNRGEFKGIVKVDGISTLNTTVKDLSTKVGIVFQNPENQLIGANVERVIEFGLQNIALKREEITERVERVVKELRIDDIRHRSIDSLSGGEKQKVAIASVLAMNCKILVLDEPLSQLDPKSGLDFLRFLQNLSKSLGVILVEHRLGNVLQFVMRVILIDEGEIRMDASPRAFAYGLSEEIVELPKFVKIARLLGLQGVLTKEELKQEYDRVYRS
ncbi:MAG: ABC transporter ATP-binding protein [archaeon]|nr:ABC transporter ATP-binding protein [archaeon]MCP8315610.1 ABC transporter ATP-binding protein [archaeon]MCP8320718.1 ABC transporter ATP-binding protein [archaeon]